MKQREPLLIDLLCAKKFKDPQAQKYDLDCYAGNDVQVFKLSKEVAIAAGNLVTSSNFVFPDIEDFHLPYKNIIVEMPVISNKLLAEGEQRIIKVAARIQEIVNEEGKKGFTFFPFWQFEDGTMGFAVTEASWGTTRNVLSLTKVANGTLASVSGINSIDLSFFVPLYYVNYAILQDQDLNKVNQEFVRFAYEQPAAVKQTMDELAVLLFGAQLIIGCKSGLTHTKLPALAPRAENGVKYGKHKQKLLKRSGYTVVHLAESEVVDELGTISIHADIAAHYVRGHFKQRKSGIYWWSSFVRGKGEPVKREAYEVTA